MAKKKDNQKLRAWQDRLSAGNNDWALEVEKMDRREALYNGDKEIKKVVEGDKVNKASHVRNVIFENIESMISSSIPQPKVTPWRKEDEHLASIIEHFIRNELDRLPFETINDMAERTVPMQGGVGYQVEWDHTKRSFMTVGENLVTVIHPKQFVPQPGVYTGIGDMDWFIVKIPMTKKAVRRRYGVDVSDENEAEPEIRAAGNEKENTDAVTLNVGYERNPSGGINKYSWVNDTEVEDLVDYQARRQPVCCKCGKVKPLPGQIIGTRPKTGTLLPNPDTGDPGELARNAMAAQQMAVQVADAFMTGNTEPLAGVTVGEAETKPEVEPERYGGGPCPWCGSNKWKEKTQEFEEIYLPFTTPGGVVIEGEHTELDKNGQAVMVPTLIPYYKPDLFPIVLQKNVSVFGKLLGNSDVDVMEGPQNTMKRIEQKIVDRILGAGSAVTLPVNDGDKFKIDSKDNKKWYVKDPATAQMIRQFDFKGDLQYEMAYMGLLYEEPRQMVGITDSFQGRKDATATSGAAKEFAAGQAAGRLESKRVMKNAAYAQLFELMFKFALAYSDEPRVISYRDSDGETVYEEFNRYDFLVKDANGNYQWNDRFLFSTDTSAPLENNRAAMWQEARMNFERGAYGNPQDPRTQMLFWTVMEELHYPLAAQAKKALKARMEEDAKNPPPVPGVPGAPGGTMMPGTGTM